jgi:ATP-dependent Clp protease ATP-binding subunit ClpA
VGKTETARTLAELVFGEGHLHRFDCGEFRTPEAVASLLGNRAGDRGRFGQAFDAVSKGVWLLDELEKAHPEFMPLLMAMTEGGNGVRSVHLTNRRQAQKRCESKGRDRGIAS